MRWYPENSSDFIYLELSCLKELCLFRGDGDRRIFHAFFQHSDFAAVLGASELRLPCLPDTLRVFDGSGVFQYTGRGRTVGEELSSVFLGGDGKADGVLGHCYRAVADEPIKAEAGNVKYVRGLQYDRFIFAADLVRGAKVLVVELAVILKLSLNLCPMTLEGGTGHAHDVGSFTFRVVHK